MNRKKIVVVSMIKNEADIIESFVRHTLTYADEILIADHCSADKTPKILAALRQEGLPLQVETYRRVELAHAEVMNALLQRAVREHGADLVLPIDGDEFLVNTDTADSCREVLESLRTDLLYQLNWRTYEPLHPHEEENRFLLCRPCRRGHDFAKNQKLIVGRELALQEGFRMGQGCHYAYWQQHMQEIPRTIAPDIHIAHFHWRSDEQYAAKIATSYINNVAKYSVHTITTSYLKSCYEKLAQGETVHPGTAIENPEDFDLRPYCRELPLRYSDDVRPVPLRNLMGASVLMAEAYLEEKILKRKKQATLVLPYAGDQEDLQRRLSMAENVSYPFREIFLCCLTPGAIPTLPESLSGSSEILVDRPGKDIFAQLSEKATGDYVLWLMPGESLAEDTLTQRIACIEAQDRTFALLYAAEHWPSSALSPFNDGFAVPELRDMPALLLRNTLLQYGQYPAVEMSGLLIRRNLMEACQWFRDCFIEGTPLLYTIWVRLLHNAYKIQNAIGVLPAPADCPPKQKELIAEEILWHQLEWYAVLQEYRQLIPDETYLAASRNFQQKKKAAAPLKQGVPALLWQQYEELRP